jgi:arylsulfatase A-like enzyme
MSITRRDFLVSAAAPAIARRRRPNVVFFLTDDHGPWATSATGCAGMVTPAVAALASQGTKFSRAFACTPVCSPSRLTIMSGLIPSQHGVQDWLVPRDSFGPKSTRYLEHRLTWSDVLARNGYALGLAGKWHMGHDDTAQSGFSYWATIPGGGGTYRDPVFVKNGQTIPMKGFKTDLMGDCAVEFLDSQKNTKSPFALYMPFYAPHTPLDYQPDKYRDPYSGSRFSCFPDTPRHPWQNPGLNAHHGNAQSKLGYSALITAADANMRRVLDKLDQMGAGEDTLVIFSADQGWNAGHHGLWGKGNGSIPFNMYEESIGVPMIWSHPGRIAAGRVESRMVSHYDFLPTLLDYLGLPYSPSGFRAGSSYAAALRGKAMKARDRLFFEYGPVRSVRTESLKLIRRASGEDELFDLKNDPGETANRWDDPNYTSQRAALDRSLTGFFKRAGAPVLADWKSTTKQNLTVYKRADAAP